MQITCVNGICHVMFCIKYKVCSIKNSIKEALRIICLHYCQCRKNRLQCILMELRYEMGYANGIDKIH